MDKGRIAMSGTPGEIFTQREKLKEYKLDVPQVTTLAYELRERGIDVPADVLSPEELVKSLTTRYRS
jgi:energy-coupling factor transport system ATP-binding protein